MRVLLKEQIIDAVADLIVKASRKLPPDVLSAMDHALSRESSPQGREVLAQLMQNAELAGTVDLPLCQDTGSAVFFVEMGTDIHIEQPGLPAILEQAVIASHTKAFLRNSICHPFSRKNTGTNTPIFLHLEFVPGDQLRIAFLPKGGGAENMSRLAMFSPAHGLAGVKKFVLDTILAAGPNPCPPIIVGVGVGGSFELVPLLAKKALLMPLDQSNPDPDAAELDDYLLAEINKFGIGPGGLGGDFTCLGVRSLIRPCHIASLPVAVNIQCNSARRGAIII